MYDPCSNSFAGLQLLAVLACCGCNADPPDSTGSLDAAAPMLDAAAAIDAAVPPDASRVADDVSPTLDPICRKGSVPALGAAVFRGDRLIAIGICGVRKQGDPTPATVDDQWHLGSDTKAMTATLIGLYVDRGKIHFDDTIATLFAGEK